MSVSISDSGIVFNDGSLQPTALTTGTQTIAGAKTFSGAAVFTSGLVSTSPTSDIGYDTGAGGTVTQATSQATAVTLNKPTGQITMFSAAGSAAWNSFTVNNSVVASTDAVVVNVKTGSSNAYSVHVGKVADGSFVIYFQSIFGTTTEAPVINFAIIKGATA